MAGDGYRTVQVFELFGVYPESLLTTPTQTFRPSRITNRHAVNVLDQHFDLLRFALGSKAMSRCVVIFLHRLNKIPSKSK